MDCIRKNWRLLLLGFLIAAATLAVFWPVVHHKFINYDATLAAPPKLASALDNLTWLLAAEPDVQFRNGARAVASATGARQLTEWRQPFLIGTLTTAYTRAGGFPKVVSTAERVRNQAHTIKLEEVAKHNEELLELDRAGM